MIYVRRADDISCLPLSPETVTQLRALGVNTVGAMFDDPRGVEEAEEWSTRLIQGDTGYALLEWGTDLPARSGTLYWSMEEGKLFLFGSGAMEDYTAKNTPPWEAYRDEIREVTVCEGVINVGAGAFAGCGRLGRLEICAPLRRIGAGAFRGCAALEEIVSERTLVHCREEVFCGQEEPVIFVGYKAFEGTPLLRRKWGDFYIRGSVLMEYFGNGEAVEIPEGIEEISPMAFEYTQVRSVSFPKSLKRIGVCAFQHTRLQELVLPAKLESVEAWAFHGIRELEQVTLLNRSVEIDPTAFTATPVEADAQTVNGCWRSRYCLKLTEDAQMSPFLRVTVEEDPTTRFGSKALNVHAAVRYLLEEEFYTLVQFFPDWHETMSAPIRAYDNSRSWSPRDVDSIVDYLPQELREKVEWWYDFLRPEADAPRSTAGLCRTRRKNTPVWYVWTGPGLVIRDTGMRFIEKMYAQQT